MKSEEKIVYSVCVCLVACVAIIAFHDVEKKKIDAEINKQTEVEKTKASEAAATERTKERMNFVPWYSGGENKKEGQ